MAPFLFSVFALVTLLSSACSLPARPKPHEPIIEELQQAQPLNGLTANTNVTLQYVGLGVGVQNYTCASTSSEPKNVGAIATLFDITEYLQEHSKLASSTKLPVRYLKLYEKETCTQDPENLSDNTCEEKINSLHFPILGKHFFSDVNGTGVPTFDIYGKALLEAAKIGDLPAPAGSPKGSNGFGSVDWLLLANDSSITYELSEVYRINTAGGEPNPDACSDGQTAWSVKYAAQYWFYL